MSFFDPVENKKQIAVGKLKEDPLEEGDKDPRLPRHPFMMLVIAPRRSGKTHLVVDFITHKDKYAHFFDLIFVWSKSYHADTKWKKNMRLAKECVFTDFDPNQAEAIFNDLIRLNKMCSHMKPKPRALCIFDDCVNERVSSVHKPLIIEKIATIGRHFSISCIVISQAVMKLSPAIRTNTTNLIMFRIPNAKEMQNLVDENCEGLTHNQFMEIYNRATGKQYGFLHINNQAPPADRFADGWNTILRIK